MKTQLKSLTLQFICACLLASVSAAQEASSSIGLYPAHATISGTSPRYISGLIKGWNDPQDCIKWTAKIANPGIYNVILEYIAVAPKPGSLVEVAVGNQGAQGRLQSCENWNVKSACTLYLGQVKIDKAGEVPINVSVLDKKGEYVMDLRSVRLDPTGETIFRDLPKKAVHPAF